VERQERGGSGMVVVMVMLISGDEVREMIKGSDGGDL